MLDQPDKVAVAQMLQTQEIYGSNPIHLLNYIATGKPPHLQYDIWWSATFNLKETLFDQIWIFICIKQQCNNATVAIAQMLQTQEIYGSNPIHLLNYTATGKPSHPNTIFDEALHLI